MKRYIKRAFNNLYDRLYEKKMLAAVLALSITFTVLFLMVVGMQLYDGGDIVINAPEYGAENGVPVDAEFIRCRVDSHMGQSRLLRVSFNIPCRDKGQKRELEAEMSRFKSAVLTRIDPIMLEKWIDSGDFESYRRAVLNILNQTLSEPVSTLYFERINYN